MKKKFLSVLFAFSILLSTWTGMAMAETEAIEAKIFSMLNGLEIGAKPVMDDHRAYVNPEARDSAKTEVVASLVGCTDVPMLSVNSDAELDHVKMEFNNKSADNTQFEFVTGFDQAQAVMLYVKAPQSDEARVWVELKSVPTNNTGGEKKASMNVNQPYSTLAKGTDTWVAGTSDNVGYMPLSSGFEGWVRIPMTSFAMSATGEFDWLYCVTVQLSNVGGTSGAAVIGAPMMITKNSDSVNVKLDGAEKAVNLFTGEEIMDVDPGDTSSETPGETPGENPGENPGDVDVSGIAAANQMVFLKGNAVDAEIPLDSDPYIALGSEIYRDALSIKAVTSLSGISDYSMLQINTKTETADPVTDLSAYSEKRKVGVEMQNLVPEDWCDISDADSMMFYVKMPKTPEATGFWMQLHVLAKNANDQLVPNSENRLEMGEGAKYYMLEKGKTEWKTATVKTHKFIDTDSGFEGWIRIPFASFTDYPYNLQEGVAYKWLYKWSVFAKEFGGSYGAMTLGAPLVVMNSAYTGAAATIDNRGTIQNLFTGEEMTREDVFPPLQPGDEVISLPDSTTDKEILYPEDKDITTETAKISWEEFDDATAYRLELYRSSIKDDTTVYIFQKAYDTKQTQQLVDGLEAGMRYVVQVRAYDDSGRELAVYESMAFSAAEDYNGETVDDGSSDTPSNGENDNPSIPETGVESILVIALLALFSGTAAFMVWRKIKRENV